MSDYRFFQIDTNIKRIADSRQLNEARIIVFGENGYTRHIIEEIRRLGGQCQAIADNDKKKKDHVIDNVPVLSPEAALLPFCETVVILIASKYYQEMKEQCESFGYREHVHIFGLQSLGTGAERDFLGDDLFSCQEKSAAQGLELLLSIKAAYGENAVIFLPPVSSIGDIYLLCLYLKTYCVKNRMEDYVLAIPGKSGTDLARHFGYKNVMQLTSEQARYLIQAGLFIGLEQTKIRIMHCGYIYQRIVCYLMMFKKYTWADNYKTFLFNLEKSVEPAFPSPLPIKSELKKIMEERGLKAGRTVVLSPYANTLAPLQDKFWIGLTQRLKGAGYCVCTNVTSKEKEINGTERLEFPILYAGEVLSYLGIFIGLRSGFCDIISNSNCKKIILYTTEVFETIKVFEFYSLKKMGLSEDVIEYEVSNAADRDAEAVFNMVRGD